MMTVELFLIAMAIILGLPWLVWRLGRTDYYAPLVIVQIVGGIVLGPGLLGAVWPDLHAALFSPPVTQALNGIAWWAVTLFVWMAGLELDFHDLWRHRRDGGITAALALGMPMLTGVVAALVLLAASGDWLGRGGSTWQFVFAIGMSCTVTALPVLLMLMEKLAITRTMLGQRVLRYASLDDIVIWSVLGLILMEWSHLGRQLLVFGLFALLAWLMRRLFIRLAEADRWMLTVIWVAVCGFGAEWAGLHFTVGAFLAGAVQDRHWFADARLDASRQLLMLAFLPVYFLSSGLRTEWSVGGWAVLATAALLLMAAVGGKLAGTAIASRLLGWRHGDASLIGWLLQTKGLVTIIFANVLLDKAIISNQTFTALLLMAVFSTMLTVPMVAGGVAAGLGDADGEDRGRGGRSAVT